MNYYLDIADAIEENDLSQLQPLECVPELKGLPRKFKNSKYKQDAREYVLQKSSDPGIMLNPNFKYYCSCKKPLFLHLLGCQNCLKKYSMCCVSGNMVLEQELVQCTSCQINANKEDWNKFIKYKQCCANCGSPETFK